MRRAALLDINVLIALFDAAHVNHDAAHEWFAAERRAGWATCPMTENGLIRVLSNAAYSDEALRPAEIARRLAAFRDSGEHVFWAAKLSLTDARVFALEHVTGHRQLTDIYLLGLAAKSGGRLATFDRSIPLRAVTGARAEHLAVIPA